MELEVNGQTHTVDGQSEAEWDDPQARETVGRELFEGLAARRGGVEPITARAVYPGPMLGSPSLSWTVLRITVGLQFMAAGAFSALKWSATVDFNAVLVGAALAPTATAAAIVLNLVGGLSILTAVRPRWGAVCLLVFLVPATVRHLLVAQQVISVLDQVPVSEPAALLADWARRGQLASLAKNVALAGVAAFIALGGMPETLEEREG